jgi:hypothetical protein
MPLARTLLRSWKRGSSNADWVTTVCPESSAAATMPLDMARRIASISSAEKPCTADQWASASGSGADTSRYA